MVKLQHTGTSAGTSEKGDGSATVRGVSLRIVPMLGKIGGTAANGRPERAIATATTPRIPANQPGQALPLAARALPADEASRLQALRRYAVAGSPAEAEFDRIAAAAADVCEAPIAMITLIGDEQIWFKSSFGADLGPGINVGGITMPLEHSLCARALRHDGVLNVLDASQDERFADSPLVTGPLSVRFYAGAPLVTPEGHRLGTICVIDQVPRTTGLSRAQLRMLTTLSEQVVSELELRRIRRDAELQRQALAEANSRLQASEHAQSLLADTLRESESRFQRMADASPMLVWLTGQELGLSYVSSNAFAFTGVSAEELIGRGWRAVVHPDDIARLTRRASKARRLHSGFDVDMRVRHQDGTWRWMLNSARPRFSPEGVFMGHVGSVIDINDRKRTEAELALAQHRLTAALDGSDVGVWEFDFVTGKLWLSEGAMGIGGEVEGQPLRNGLIQWQDAVHPDDLALLTNAFEEFMAGTISKMECEIRVRGGNGNWIWVINRGTAVESDAEGRPLRVAGTVTDIDERRRAEDRLKWTADHDLLTGLANRGLFRRRLDAALTELKADIAIDRVPPARLAVALLDLDHFKQVNDHFGHATGDAMLVAMAQRLEGFIGATETAARLGGDEFTLILRDFVTDEALQARLDGLSELLRQPIEIDGHDFACGASIGVTLAPEDGLDVASMLKNADKAMYRAKAAGRGVAMMFGTDETPDAAAAVAGATATIA